MHKMMGASEHKPQMRKKALEQRTFSRKSIWSAEDNYLDEGRRLVSQGWTQPPAEIDETPTEVIVRMRMPGVSEEQIEIDVKKEMVRVKGEVRLQKSRKEKNEFFIEREYKGFYRVLSLPAEVRPDEVKKSFYNEVLEIRLAKAKPHAGHNEQDANYLLKEA